jgi:starch synthase (maltosyl-transferring)
VAPELGSLEDFDWLVDEIHRKGMEIALDFAINCSPDHPYVHDHPDWFYKRPDGSIKYAENPPKKYQDVFPLNFHNPDWRSLWEELTAVVLFWAQRKVRIFRVDNPHTKPVAFWEFLISKVQHQFPDTIFLSEAFTRPKMMLALAKVGFTQSYTYFTWRNTKHEITEYFTQLTQAPQKDFFRPNLWPNTPDILPFFLQFGGPPAFVIRFILAATLSPTYGIYSGFELCENAALPHKEEYLDSEKYQFKARDWSAAGNIKPLITKLNGIRRRHPSLQSFDNLAFHPADNESILFYSKSSPAEQDLLLIVISLDYQHPQAGFIEVPLHLLGLQPNASFTVSDLLSDEQFLWHGSRNYVSLTPHGKQAHVFKITRKQVTETDYVDF